MPFDCFRRQVETRAAQGFTVYQAHGHRPLFADSQLGALEATRQGDAETLRYWRETDRYLACGDEHGLLGMIGFARGDLLDALSLDELKRLWHYYGARYDAVWFDPRTGRTNTLERLDTAGGELKLPPRPDKQDWMRIFKRSR